MIITGDNRAEMSLGYSIRTDIGQTNETDLSTINSDQIEDQRQNLNLQGQYQTTERLQLASKILFF